MAQHCPVVFFAEFEQTVSHIVFPFILTKVHELSLKLILVTLSLQFLHADKVVAAYCRLEGSVTSAKISR